eukprot:TRINITY_DN3800_c2_g1_i1.p1 TRINITY_DN3800_c2_g1~~TRINITY_DN3800_c2_g1_i1.p1  ORF type:complete len:295 (+),score=131.95 TRINITY_DN3800_c2_g1_i1:58-942(+)
MAFALNIATLYNGTQYSSRLAFPAAPTVGDLVAAAEAEFRGKVAAWQAAGVQVYDAGLQQWVELQTAAQLTHDAQLFFSYGGVAAAAAAAAPPLAPRPGTTPAMVASPTGKFVVNALPPSLKPGVVGSPPPAQATHFSPPHRLGSHDPAVLDGGRSPPALVPAHPAQPRLDVGAPLYTLPGHAAPNCAEMDNIAAQVARTHEVRRAAVLGYGPEAEAADRAEREVKKFDLDVQIRQLTTRNHLDRIRSVERAENDSMALARAATLGAASPPRVRHDLCRMYCSPPTTKQVTDGQ